MSGELGTTNLFLGIMAVVSILEGLVIVGMGVAGFVATLVFIRKEEIGEPAAAPIAG